MYKIFSLKIKVLIIISLFTFCAPQSLFAAELNYRIVPNSNTDEYKSTVVEIRIDPEGKNLNVVEGSIIFNGPAVDTLSVEVSTEGSVFTMWPSEPVYNSLDKVINFVGGTPSGFNKEGLLMTLYLVSASSGDLDISWSGVKTYLNDGKGTEEGTKVNSIFIKLGDKYNQDVNKETYSKNERPVLLFSGFNINNYVIVLILIIILMSAIFYGYKKNI